MCFFRQGDKECANEDCHNVVEFNGHNVPVECMIVENDKSLGFGGCDSGLVFTPGDNGKAKKRICDICTQRSSKLSSGLYDNYGQIATMVREEERQNDEERRLRDAERRSATPMPAEQAAPAYGTMTEWSAGQVGHDLGASGVHFDSEMDLNAMPQESDVRDSGEGPSHSHDQGYNQRGDGGHNQRGDHGSGGWSRQ